MPSSRVADAVPYYPYYTRPDGDMPGAGPWNGPFDGEGRAAGADGSSSWMDPSFNAPTFKKGTAADGSVDDEDSWGPWHGKFVGSTVKKYHFGSECSDRLDNQRPGIQEDYVKSPCDIPEMPVLGSAVRKGPPYLYSTDLVSIMEDCNAYSSNFAYDSFINKFVSTSMDTMLYYPDAYTSVQACAPSVRRTNPSMDCRIPTNTYPATQKGNLCKVRDDNADYLLGKRPEFINQNAESEEGYFERSIPRSNIKANIGNFVESSLRSYNFLFGSDPSHLTIANSTVCPTDMICGSETAHLNHQSPFPSGGGSFKADDPMKTSSETLDLLNHTVDSPCWKGTPFSRHSSLAVGEEIDPRPSLKEPEVNPHPSVNELSGSDDLTQHQKHEVDPPGENESLMYMTSSNSSDLFQLRELPPFISLRSRDKEIQDGNEDLSNYAKTGNEMGGQCRHILGGERVEALTYPQGISEPKDCGVQPIGHQGTGLSPDQPILAGEAHLDSGLEGVPRENPCDYGYCSPLGKDSQVLVKAIHDLSEVLLSVYSGGAHELKEHDQEVVQLVIDNLKTLTHKRKKGVTKDNSLLSGTVTGQSHVTKSNPDISMNHGTSKINEVVNEAGHYAAPSMRSDKFDNDNDVPEHFGIFTGMPQILEKSLEQSLHEQDENPQTLLYKKLWIEAEATLCSLKYTRLKFEMENRKNLTAHLHDSPKFAKKITKVSRRPSSVPVLDGQDVPRCESLKCLYEDVVVKDGYVANSNRPSEVDGSVMARYRVLTDRDQKLCSKGASDQEKLAMGFSNPESENNTASKFLQAKLADFGFMDENPQSSKVTKKVTQVSRRLRSMPILDGEDAHEGKSPKSMYDGVSTEEGLIDKNNYERSQELNTYKASEVDASVMARYRVLTGRDENLSPMSAEDQEKLAVSISQPESRNNTAASRRR